ncbi:MAG: T9SS type A sorting domain-containing protein, partial [Crocinitomicaceae bacterium]|nr:T9SS type A sorting domain-containing protein [Crocinitomicaceae bacterium]
TDELGATTYYRLTDINAANSLHYLGFNGTVTNIEIDPHNYIINQDGTITQNSSVVEIKENNDALKVYPVPAENSLTVEIKSPATYQIISAAGQVILSGNLVQGKNTIDLSYLTAGNYILKTNTEQISFSKK